MTEEGKAQIIDSVTKQTNWPVIRALWCADVPNDELAKEFGVSEDSIRMQAMRNDWDEARQVVRQRAEKNALQAVTGAQNIVLSYKQKIAELVGEAGHMTAKGLQRAVKDAGSDYIAQTEAFTAFEPTARVLKPILGFNDNAQVQVGVQVNMAQEIEAMPDFELPK